jgi:high-affinity iron transporter
MFPSAIIVFREVFEIVLIVGIILAATHGMPHRKKSIYLGFGGGILGSGMIALFTSEIANFAEGVGQELFNAAILFTAAAFIGWTALWMKRHAREMKSHFTNVSKAVADGDLPFYSLALVIGLALLREGSEIVLFSYGMIASGQSVLDLLMGSALGLGGGLIIGVLIYKGLLKLSPKHFFTVTTWLLVFLVAGMMAQGTGFLVAAGHFGTLATVLWDSSWLLSEKSMLGQTLHTLIGYTARPAIIQVMIYAITLAVLFTAMRFTGKPSHGATKQKTSTRSVA